MPRKALFTLSILSLIGCSGLAGPPDDMTISVDSVPVGASVIVMGEALGQTPITLRKRDLFPRHPEPGKQHLYGRIELTYPGCEPFVSTVTSRIVREGLTARLTCDDPGHTSVTTPSPAPQQTPAKVPPPANLKLRLQQLKALFDEGLISEQDYAAKRRELLQEL